MIKKVIWSFVFLPWLCLAGSLADATERGSAMDVVLVVDTSGSMAWDVEGRKSGDPGFAAPARIDLVLGALERYAQKLPDGTRLRLISFNTGIKTNREFVLSESNRADLIQRLRALRKEVNSGDTWLWEAMREGIKAAEAYASGDPDLSVTLYVLTDGEYDNKDASGDLSLGRVLAGSTRLGSDSLYASLVLLGKTKSQGGSFSDEYLGQLKREAGTRCDVQMDDDFDPLFPPILEILPEKVVPNQKVSVIENSAVQFARVEWSLNGRSAGTQKNLVFTPTKLGRYEITFKGFDRNGRRARARKVLTVGLEGVRAVPRIEIDGKPLGRGMIVTRGQSLALSHQSLGPVARAEWNINGEKVVAASLNRVLDSVGRQTISLAVESTRAPTGEVTRSTSQPIVFDVVLPSVTAVPEVIVNGKPLGEVKHVYVGDTLQFVSKSTGPVETAVWNVNGEELLGNRAQWSIPAAGKVLVRLKVSGSDPGQADESDIINITAKKPPPIWMLWAIGIAELLIFAFFFWLFTGNQARDCVLRVKDGARVKSAKYFSRLQKRATVPLNKLKIPHWRKSPDAKALVIESSRAGSGPPVSLGCTFHNEGGGSVRFGEDIGKPPTPTERYYVLEDEQDPENPQLVEFILIASKRSFVDVMLLGATTIVLIAFFFWFYVKVYSFL